MTSIDRTAYPQFARVLSTRELAEAFTPTEAEVEWARSCTDDEHHLLALVVWLKSYQRLGYFPKLTEVPAAVAGHVRQVLGLAGSLTLGEVRGHDLIRMLSRDGRPTGLGDAFAHYGRIFKTLHLLQFISDDGYRRMIGKQLNITEARHRLARRIFFGQRGELRQNYREGMEDQLGALGLALNSVVLWNSLYLDRAAKQLAADGFPVTDDLLARLSPLQFDHINFLGRYAFFRPQEAGRRPLRAPSTDENDER